MWSISESSSSYSLSCSIVDGEDPSIQEEEKDEDMQQERSESSRTNEIMKGIRKDEGRYLPGYLEAKYPVSFLNWPILCLLNPKFVTQIHMVMVYDDGNRALIVTKDQNVYSFHFDKNDPLYKSGESRIGYFYPKKIEELCGKAIKTFACSSHFVSALTEEGKVFFWRFKKPRFQFNKSYLSDIKPTEKYFNYMKNKCIVDIACGSDHFLALTSDGEVYAWGMNNSGQIGTQRSSVTKYTCGRENYNYSFDFPRKVKRLKENKIAFFACGSKFSMAISEEGNLYSWGQHYNRIPESAQQKAIHRMGIGEVYSPHPYRIVLNITIVKVACGFEHTLALSNRGNIYAWGKNDKGQMGIGRISSNWSSYGSAVKVKMPELVSDIAAHGNLSVAVGIKKTIYVWGDFFGQKIGAPVLTGFSTVHDAFAYTSTRVMHMPLIVSDNKDELSSPLDSLGFNDLSIEFNVPSKSDFIVCVEGQGRIYVNSLILSSRCKHFENKFQHQTKNNRRLLGTPELYIVSDFSYVVYKAFFKYLYTGKVDLPLENVLDLMKLADKYSETNLKKECHRMIMQAITASNVAFYCGKAIEYNDKVLEEFCFQFALRHMKVVVLSNDYKKLDASIKDTFIQRAAEENFFKT